MSPLSAIVEKRILMLLNALEPPIRTVEDLLSCDVIATANRLRIPLQEFSDLKLKVTKKLLNINTSLQEKPQFKTLSSPIPALNAAAGARRITGITQFDTILHGGFPAGCLVTLLGTSSSGKTYISTSVAAESALSGMRTIVISSTNDITPKRIQISLEAAINRNQNPARPLNPAQLQDHLLFGLSKVTLASCHDLWSLLNILTNIVDRIASPPELVIIDCMHHIIAPLLTASTAQSNSMNRTISVQQGQAPGSHNNSGSCNVLASTSALNAVDMLNSLLCQVVALLRILTSRQCTVLLTNSPANSLSGNNSSGGSGFQRRHSSGGSSNNNSGGGGGGGGGMIVGAHGSGGNDLFGTGMGVALLDCLDISIQLDRMDRGDLGRATTSYGGVAEASLRTVIRASKWPFYTHIINYYYPHFILLIF